MDGRWECPNVDLQPAGALGKVPTRSLKKEEDALEAGAEDGKFPGNFRQALPPWSSIGEEDGAAVCRERLRRFACHEAAANKGGLAYSRAMAAVVEAELLRYGNEFDGGASVDPILVSQPDIAEAIATLELSAAEREEAVGGDCAGEELGLAAESDVAVELGYEGGVYAGLDPSGASNPKALAEPTAAACCRLMHDCNLRAFAVPAAVAGAATAFGAPDIAEPALAPAPPALQHPDALFVSNGTQRIIYTASEFCNSLLYSSAQNIVCKPDGSVATYKESAAPNRNSFDYNGRPTTTTRAPQILTTIAILTILNTLFLS